MQVINNHYVFEHHNPEHIKSFIPDVKDAVVQGRQFVAVPHKLEAAQVLNRMGLDAPSPIRTEYNWPLRPDWTPGWWQINTAEFMTLNRRGHVHNAMRTRKTMSALWAIDYLQRLGLIRKALITAPISSLELAWAASIYVNMPHKKFAVLHASAKARKEMLAKDFDIYIINHDGIEVILPELLARTDIDCHCVDELHEYKNHKTKKWQALNKVINRSHTSYAWGLTGTPTPQGIPTDSFGQMKLITPSNYASSFTRLKQDTMFQVSQFKWVPRRSSEEMVKKLLSPSIRYDRSVVTDIEPCLIERHAEMSREQHKHYADLKRHAVTEIRGVGVNAVNAATLCSKIAQCCCGVIYGQGGEFLEIDFGPRLKVVEELIENNDEKVLVFVPFTGALEALAAELRKKWKVAVIDGSVTPAKRNQVFKDFQTTPDPHVIVAHPNTMSYSLELTKASLVVWYAPPVTGNKVYQQACARIDGAHQKHKMDIAHISSCPEERAMYEVLMGKGKWQDVLLNMK